MRSGPTRAHLPPAMRRIGPECAVAVFAKAPVPGTVKTRLVPPLTPVEAADLQRRLLLHALDTATGCAHAVSLHCAPDVTHRVFAACAQRWPLALHPQRGDTLGARLHHAFDALLGQHRAAIIIGTDAPALAADALLAANDALANDCPAVFVPADDGGYALIGLTRCASELFADVAWGTERVMAQTRAALRTLGWHWTELPPVWDVDRPDDYARLVREGRLDALPA